MPVKTAKKNTSVKSDTKNTRAIVNKIREDIRVGRLLPGHRLVEADIVKETGASRNKVREALQRLEAEGLVSIEEFRGASVRRLSMDDIHQIYKTRMALEGMAAREFAISDNTRLKMQLQKIQQQMNDLEQSGDHDRFAGLNDAWHGLIIEGSGNGYAAQFLAQLTVPIYRLLFTSFYNAQRIDAANADHKIITKAIIDGDPVKAEQTMREHIQQGLNALAEINARLAF